jgi:hypothetical protein
VNRVRLTREDYDRIRAARDARVRERIRAAGGDWSDALRSLALVAMETSVTQHRCTDGAWKPGRVRHCIECQAAGVKRPVKVKGRLES